MIKVILQLSVLVVLFLAVWFGISRIDFVKKFSLNKLGTKTEQKIGEVVLKTIVRTNTEVNTDATK
jgi:hypothetical protein